MGTDAISRFVTISVDDGHPSDVRTADLLQKYGLKATFYLPRRNHERNLMSEQEIKALGRCYELGAHTVNNLRLKRLPKSVATQEINQGKEWLQDLTGVEVTSFCYPGGKFDSTIVQLVREAGYLGARTCQFNRHELPRNPFLFGVSAHACRHSMAIQFRHAILERNLRGAWNYISVYRLKVDWKQQFLLSLDYVERHGGVAHLFLHSWEIEAHGEWAQLESVFKEISERSNLIRISNGDLFRYLHN
jgi:peptidoglycan-N-acetylglucosamine deacetylase